MVLDKEKRAAFIIINYAKEILQYTSKSLKQNEKKSKDTASGFSIQFYTFSFFSAVPESYFLFSFSISFFFFVRLVFFLEK